jgi:pimeloyl-ACP methyl ester carboxylesterase
VQPLIREFESVRSAGAPSRPALQELWLEVKRLRVHCLKAGRQDHPVLLLHGGGLDAAGLSFRTTIPALAERHCVYAPDWPGFGRSDPMPMSWRVEECVDFVGEILDALEIKRVSLVGVSMGGTFALGFSLRAPERIDRLVLVDSAGMGNDIPGGLLSYLAMRLPLLDELRWSLLVGNRTLARRILCAAFVDCHQVLTEENSTKSFSWPGRRVPVLHFASCSEANTNGMVCGQTTCLNSQRLISRHCLSMGRKMGSYRSIGQSVRTTLSRTPRSKSFRNAVICRLLKTQDYLIG